MRSSRESDAERCPILVAIDGRSGAGKSILGSMVAGALNVALIPSDDFYAAEISNDQWDHGSPAEKVADVINWRRLRVEALEPLLRGQRAEWHTYDFARVLPDGTYPLRRCFWFPKAARRLSS